MLVAQLGQHGTDFLEVQASHFFVQMLGQHIDLADIVGVLVCKQLDLRNRLVGKRRRHHETGVTRAAAQVHQTALGQQDDLFAIREDDVVDLGLDFFPLALFFQLGHLDFVVEVADVAHNGLVLHGGHVFKGDHILVAGGGHENVGLVGCPLHGHYTIAFHRGLQGVDRVDLGHPHLSAQGAQGLGAAFAHVTVTGDHGHFASDHHVGGALDAVHQRLAATVQVVELALGHRVIDVDGAEHQGALGGHFLQAVHAGGGLFGHANDLRALAAVPGAVLGELGLDGGKQDALFFAAGIGQHFGVLFSLFAQVHQQRGVAAIVQDHVGAFALAALRAKVENAVGVVPVLLQCLALDGKHRGAARGDGSSSVVLGGEDVARCPAHFGAQGLQGFDQHSRLNGHVQRAGDACTFERLLGREFFANRHQAGHFGFGNLDLFAAPVGQANVGDHAVRIDGGFERCIHVSAPKAKVS